jgi:hypothetical protein
MTGESNTYLTGLDVLIVLEDQAIHHRISRAAKNQGIKVHSLALWEWFLPSNLALHSGKGTLTPKPIFPRRAFNS